MALPVCGAAAAGRRLSLLLDRLNNPAHKTATTEVPTLPSKEKSASNQSTKGALMGYRKDDVYSTKLHTEKKSQVQPLTTTSLSGMASRIKSTAP